MINSSGFGLGILQRSIPFLARLLFLDVAFCICINQKIRTVDFYIGFYFDPSTSPEETEITTTIHSIPFCMLTLHLLFDLIQDDAGEDMGNWFGTIQNRNGTFPQNDSFTSVFVVLLNSGVFKINVPHYLAERVCCCSILNYLKRPP